MIILILVLLGLCFGSFINALVYRLHKQENSQSLKVKKEYSISNGRSKCFNCNHTLEVIDLIPVLSWIVLKGRCRYCRIKIPDNPLSEVLTPFLMVISYIYWPVSLNGLGILLFAIWLVLIIGFVALILYDFKWYLLPDKIVYPLIFVASIFQITKIFIYGINLNVLIELTLSVLVAAGLFWLLFQISKGKWIGGGDVKLGIVIGLVLSSPILSFLYIFIASLLGTFASVALIIAGKYKRKAHIPFGPFLIISAVITMLFGQKIIDLYLKLAGI